MSQAEKDTVPNIITKEIFRADNDDLYFRSEIKLIPCEWELKFSKEFNFHGAVRKSNIIAQEFGIPPPPQQEDSEGNIW
jgi:hypothetical protein